MMNSREVVQRTLCFRTPDRLAYDFPEKYGSDFIWAGLDPSPDDRPSHGVDQWGAVWENASGSLIGHVVKFPLESWNDLSGLKIPNANDPSRWAGLEGIREKARDKFILGYGYSIYERIHFLRGIENTWIDIRHHSEQLGELIDILVDINLQTLRGYSLRGIDSFIMTDDWGLQNRLMIDPADWRKIWKPRYARIFDAAHQAGMYTFLHSCGYIVDILPDLIEVGLDAIHMDQQENMGLDLLNKKFAGKITFFSPVDIQKTMIYGTLDDIRQYCHKMVECLGTPDGGFIPRWYIDPVGAGHRPEALDAMCDEFLKINRERYGK